MILLANLMNGIALILNYVIDFFFIVIIASVIISWVNADPRNMLVHSIRSITDPLYSKVRSFVPPIGIFDISPILVLLVLLLIRAVIVDSLIDYSNKIKINADLVSIFEPTEPSFYRYSHSESLKTSVHPDSIG